MVERGVFCVSRRRNGINSWEYFAYTISYRMYRQFLVREQLCVCVCVWRSVNTKRYWSDLFSIDQRNWKITRQQFSKFYIYCTCDLVIVQFTSQTRWFYNNRYCLLKQQGFVYESCFKIFKFLFERFSISLHLLIFQGINACVFWYVLKRYIVT